MLDNAKIRRVIVKIRDDKEWAKVKEIERGFGKEILEPG